MTEDSDSSETASSGKSTSSERSPTRKRKLSNVNLSDSNEALLKRIEELESIVKHGQGTPCKTAKVANDKTPIKNTPINYAKSIGKSVAQRKSSSDSNNASKSTDALEYDCKLCEGTFKSKPARNIHYTGTHKVENEKLLFFPDGTGLVESTLEHHLRLKLDYLKAAARNMSSRVCKLCKVELDMDDLKWHYEKVHKVIQMSKVKPLICLNNADIKIIAEPFRCEYCPRTFDDEARLKMHLVTHRANSDEMKCKFCKLNFKTNLYNAHVKKEHPKMYLKRIGTTNEDANTNKSNGNNVARPKKYKRPQIKFSCRFCAFKCSSPVTLRQHRQSVHKGNKRLNKLNKETTKCRHNNDSAEGENKKKKESELNSTSEHDSSPIICPQAIMLYLCEECDLATTSYDEAVSHSQDHILDMVNNKTTLCEHCNLKFSSDYETHKQLHMIHDELDIDSFQCITYDHKLLFTDEWFDMFDFLPKVKVKIIAGDHSVYFPTRCIRFKLTGGKHNSSAPFFLFQCVTCRNYVDPYSIESHVQEQSCSVESNSHPCEVCRRPFYSDIARIQHSDTHKVPDADSKYRTILFNDQSDLTTNESLLRAANKSVPQKRNKVIATGNVAMQVEANKPIEGTQDADQAKENMDPCGPEKLAVAYKCRCGLCFHTLPHLHDHLQKCFNTSVERETCKCGLVFDSQHYLLHHKVHCCYTAIVVKEIIIRPVRLINISGMVEEFKNSVLTPKGNAELVNKETTANCIKPSDIMVDDNKCYQEPTVEKDKDECIRGTQNKIKEKMVNLSQESHNKSPPKIGRGPENPQKPINMTNQHKSETTVLPNETETSAEKPKNSKVISDDDLKKVISMYNYIKDAMKSNIIVAEPQTAMEVTENNDSNINNTPQDSTWRSNVSNKEENRSLVATTIEVEARNQRAPVESNANKNIRENSSRKVSETGVNTELEDEVAKEKHDQAATQDVHIAKIKRNSDTKNPKRNSTEMRRDSLNTSQRATRENEIGRNFKNNPTMNAVKREPVEGAFIEYNEDELLKDYDEEENTLCPDIVDLLTDDED